MILYNVNNELKALCKLNLTRPIETANNIYIDGEEYITPEDIIEILTRNGNIRIFNGEKFKKYKLGEFGDIILNKDFIIFFKSFFNIIKVHSLALLQISIHTLTQTLIQIFRCKAITRTDRTEVLLCQ